MASFAGTYFTSWEFDQSGQGSYQLGPIVVIGTDNSLVVDGVTMVGAVVLDGISASWSSSAGNPSTGVLSFSCSSTLNAMTFSGFFWMNGQDQPTSPNFFGFNTQPQASLQSWADTYYSYELVGGNDESLGNLVISGTTVTFAGQTIVNPIYTGLYENDEDTNELAWFTSDGNEDNAAISFSASAGDNVFNGNIWPAGQNRPVGTASQVNNFFGTTQSAADADAVDAQADDANDDVMAAVGAAVAFVAAVGVGSINGGDDGDDGDDDQDAEEAADEVDDDEGQAEAQAAGDANAGGDGDDGGDGDGDDAAEDAAGDDAEGGEGLGDELLEAAADVLEAVGAAVTADAAMPDTQGRKSRDASGLSAKQLLDLKNGR